MRAAAYVGDQTIRVEEREPVEPAPGQVRLDVAYVGICGTDLHIKHGAMDARVTLPATIGHEMSGTVATVGEDVGGRKGFSPPPAEAPGGWTGGRSPSRWRSRCTTSADPGWWPTAVRWW